MKLVTVKLLMKVENSDGGSDCGNDWLRGELEDTLREVGANWDVGHDSDGGDVIEYWVNADEVMDIAIEDISVEFVDEVFCEHCGKMDAGYEVNIDGISWCLNCAEANGYITEEFGDKLRKEGKKKLKAYYKKKLKELED